MGGDAATQKFVLLSASTWPGGGALDDLSIGDGLTVAKLFAGQVDLDPAGQPIPPVMALTRAVHRVDRADHQVTAEEIVNE